MAFANGPTDDRKTSMPSLLARLYFSPFGYLNCTQFLGAMNDNIFKLLAVFCFISIEGSASSHSILASVGALYVIPFLLLSATAGTMADRFSKRSIIVGAKIAECLVMLFGAWAFSLGSKPLAFTALFLLACHSAIFAPCKYGIVPEIVPPERISKANGLLTSFTFIAIIIGTFLASFLTDMSDHDFITASVPSICFAAVGLYCALKIPKTAPSGSKKAISARFLTEIVRNLFIIYKQPTLLSAVIGSSFFLFIGSYIQLNMIPFALQNLHLSDVQGGYLFLLTALGIGIGSLLAGKISGKSVELGFVPFGGLGIALCLFALSAFSDYLMVEIGLVILIGIFGGLYLVPLDSFIQIASPKTIRGQVIATSNFLGFFGVLCSAGMLYFLSETLELEPRAGFFAVGLITLTIMVFITMAIRGYLVRFICELTSKLFFKNISLEVGDIPAGTPSFIVADLPPWPWAALIVGRQRHRMRLIEVMPSQTLSAWYVRLLKYIVSVHEVASLEAIRPGGTRANLVTTAFQRGTSVAIFCRQPEGKLQEEWQSHLKDTSFFTF
ncbi:MAG: MFS transporter [Verrucomicrobia bacterium]|nr:MFS transporter [Verrucomicrobiota bacterium]